jgi:hypothetical protein
VIDRRVRDHEGERAVAGGLPEASRRHDEWEAIRMKLRIQDNRLRLRLTQTEVARLRDHGRVCCEIRFAPGRALGYSVASSSEVAEVSVRYSGDSISVVVPLASAIAWSDTDHDAIEGPRDEAVQVLLEKDFQCLHPPIDPDPDAFLHPLGARSGK